MEIVGYADQLCVAPGETIRFHVSCERPTYQADIVRLIHGDPNPHGPGFKEEVISTTVSGEYPGRAQVIHTGSHVIVPDTPALRLQDGFTLQAWIYATTPQKGVQGILTKWSDADGGYALVLDEGGVLALWVSDSAGRREQVRMDTPLRATEWYFVAATFDAQSATIALYQEPVRTWPQDKTRASETAASQLRTIQSTETDFVMAGLWQSGANRESVIGGHFNGKIDSPRMFQRALSRDELISLQRGASPLAFGDALVAAWDFSAEIASEKVRDTASHGLHGQTVNMPARAMTGYHWSGQETNFQHALHEYGAIHFHDDDLDDARWQIDFEWTLPEDFKSGVYAARLRSESAEDHIPFFVRPPKGTATADIAFLVPTNSYLAYANEQLTEVSLELAPNQKQGEITPEDQYSADNGLLSLYDHHTDGSGVCYSSRLRPIMNMRPRYRMRALGSPHQFPADLHLIDWLDAKDYTCDVITDENLHFEGVDLLASYKVIVTGSHPEYWSGPMLDALETYLQNGGRLMYLGGNGFYWVTSFAEGRPHIVEVRRWGGTRSWQAKPGEYHLSTTGEPGGMWRSRGRAPQRLVGVGFTTQGFDNSAPYQRQPDSLDPRAGFIFEGVGAEESIGDFDSLVLNHGAAGFEMDRAERSLGTPAHALVVASSSGHSDSYQHVIEEVLMSDSQQGGTVNSKVRADMVYFEYAKGGAVFSASSIAWCGALSHNQYDNNVSRITDNVLRRFATEGPLSE
jgi:N,N-dimethylformamidase